MTALLTWRRSARSSGCALGQLDVVAFGHHDVVIVVSGNSAGREAIGERSELFSEIGWCFHRFSPSGRQGMLERKRIAKATRSSRQAATQASRLRSAHAAPQ
jgi:hypothetical protein